MSPSLATPARDRLRIAIQKSGRLAEPARALLAACGLSWRESRDKLFCYGESLPVDLLLVRDDDIPGLIADGVCDLGVVGRNVLLEQAGERSRFRAAGGMHAGPGSAGSLIPPHEYHTIRNTSTDAVAVSLHIYQAPMGCCAKFAHREGEWYACETTQLATDKAA